MTDTARDLVDARAIRNAARARFESHLAQVRSDLDARGLGGRIADKIGADAAAVIEEGVEIADQHRGIVAGTIAALALWFLRNPIIAWLDAMLGKDEIEEED